MREIDLDDEQDLKDAVHEAEHEYSMALITHDEALEVLEKANSRLESWFSEFG